MFLFISYLQDLNNCLHRNYWHHIKYHIYFLTSLNFPLNTTPTPWPVTPRFLFPEPPPETKSPPTTLSSLKNTNNKLFIFYLRSTPSLLKNSKANSNSPTIFHSPPLNPRKPKSTSPAYCLTESALTLRFCSVRQNLQSKPNQNQKRKSWSRT